MLGSNVNRRQYVNFNADEGAGQGARAKTGKDKKACVTDPVEWRPPALSWRFHVSFAVRVGFGA